jgi:hypothetical protein
MQLHLFYGTQIPPLKVFASAPKWTYKRKDGNYRLQVHGYRRSSFGFGLLALKDG